MAEIVQSCGCVAIWLRGKPLQSKIKYCPKHEAVPELYEALAEMVVFGWTTFEVRTDLKKTDLVELLISQEVEGENTHRYYQSLYVDVMQLRLSDYPHSLFFFEIDKMLCRLYKNIRFRRKKGD